MYRLLRASGFRFGSFRDLAAKVQEIQSAPGRNQKTRLFAEYVSALEGDKKAALKSLFTMAFTRFSRLMDKTLVAHCNQLRISEQNIADYLTKQNNVLNAVASLYQPENPPQQLQLSDLLHQFQSITQLVGHKSVQMRVGRLGQLLDKCENREQRRLVLSMLTGRLQIGFQKTSIEKVLDDILPEQKTSSQHKYACMLTKPLKNFEEAIKFAQNSRASAECKFDGQRTHVQFRRNQSLVMYSRNGKSQLEKYPDIEEKAVAELNGEVGLQDCILDGEIICVDSRGEATPIQVLLNRKGKSRVDMDQQYTQKVMVFDILELNGVSLIGLPYTERIKLIPQFSKCQLFMNVQRRFFNFPEQQNQFKLHFQEVVENGYEGLILKKIDSPYDIKRGRTKWAKLKQGDTEQGTTGRTVDVDLVLMGAFRGKGKRHGIFGSYLLGVNHNGNILPVTKTGTTLSQQMFEEVFNQIQKQIVEQIPIQYTIPKRMPKPDVWIRPRFVVQVSSQQWSRSPVYQFDKKQQGGLSLRFPRFIRIRDDKSIIDATRGQQILQLLK